ncbi:hypothetical protein BpHYR1_010299 [Brachionus plicatilis]|uniref:Uncharacterized protein n=1 Tax=Brachionus plicatilis TaxID=10195 RepID=A0A3M7Q9E7_BRAPC|nr:hypothetical protein BpHYR1_010299 [Brachionus plicatilis]
MIELDVTNVANQFLIFIEIGFEKNSLRPRVLAFKKLKRFTYDEIANSHLMHISLGFMILLKEYHSCIDEIPSSNTMIKAKLIISDFNLSTYIFLDEIDMEGLEKLFNKSTWK